MKSEKEGTEEGKETNHFQDNVINVIPVNYQSINVSKIDQTINKYHS